MCQIVKIHLFSWNWVSRLFANFAERGASQWRILRSIIFVIFVCDMSIFGCPGHKKSSDKNPTRPNLGVKKKLTPPKGRQAQRRTWIKNIYLLVLKKFTKILYLNVRFQSRTQKWMILWVGFSLAFERTLVHNVRAKTQKFHTSRERSQQKLTECLLNVLKIYFVLFGWRITAGRRNFCTANVGTTKRHKTQNGLACARRA